jgi:glutamine amidotransferase
MCRFMVCFQQESQFTRKLTTAGIQRQGRDTSLRAHPKPFALHPHTILRLAPATRKLHIPSLVRTQLTTHQDRRRPHNGDGFGIGYYTSPSLGPEPCVFTSTIPAWNCINLSRIASKTTSSLIFAHVRATTEGNLSDSNCHPFSYKSLMFMHNGGIGCFRQIKRRLAMSLNEQWFTLVQGSTDSEWAFATFLDCLDKAGISPNAEPGKGGFGHTVLRKAILKTIERINGFIKEVVGDEGMGNEDSRSLLNFAVTDGESVVCTRYVSSKTDEAASLFFSSGTSWKELKTDANLKHSEDTDRDYVMERRDKGSDIVLVASEPLTFERGMS